MTTNSQITAESITSGVDRELGRVTYPHRDGDSAVLTVRRSTGAIVLVAVDLEDDGRVARVWGVMHLPKRRLTDVAEMIRAASAA